MLLRGRLPSTVRMVRAAEGAASRAAVSSPQSPWILGEWQDLVFIIATPLLVYCGIELAHGRWTAEQITQFVVVWAFGHHLPGMMRAYGDRELFARFRARFVVAPAALILVCVATVVSGHPGIYLLGAFWGWWHYLMQAYGFSRIYDAKVGSVAWSTQALDKGMCLAWFAAPMLLYPGALTGLVLSHARDAGLPELSSRALEAWHTAVLIGVAGVTGAFAVHTTWQWSRGRGPSLLKLALMASTFSFYWYSVTTVTNLLVAYALFELFHDIQYLTIVWTFNRGRLQGGADLPAFTRFLFRPRMSRIALYLGLIACYGMLERGTQLLPSETTRSAWEGVFLASTFLHYYYDGFIWKLRENATRRSLDLQPALAGGSDRRTRTWMHLARWGLFVIPLLGLTRCQ